MKNDEDFIAPGSTIGILGGGQLGKMLCIAAARLGYKTHVYTDKQNECALDVATNKTVGSYDSESALKLFAETCHVVTFEFENIPAQVHKVIEGVGILIFPNQQALAVSQDRRREKLLAHELGIETADFRFILKAEDAKAVKSFPIILKTVSGGYDGHGQVRIHSEKELKEQWEGMGSLPCVAESIVDYEFEFSVICARNRKGELDFYSPFVNVHENGILRETFWPSDRFSSDMVDRAFCVAKKIVEKLDVVGLLAVEMFYARDGRIIFNEIAPRPHNSGHITIDCAETDQFEQHIRAICGWPLGSTRPKARGRMLNFIGDYDLLKKVQRDPRVKIHLYGKKPRPGRKLGHVTILR